MPSIQELLFSGVLESHKPSQLGEVCLQLLATRKTLSLTQAFSMLFGFEAPNLQTELSILAHFIFNPTMPSEKDQ